MCLGKTGCDQNPDVTNHSVYIRIQMSIILPVYLVPLAGCIWSPWQVVFGPPGRLCLGLVLAVQPRERCGPTLARAAKGVARATGLQAGAGNKLLARWKEESYRAVQVLEA